MSEEAIDASKKTNYTRGLAEGLRTLGFSYIRLSKNQEAFQTLEKALPLFEELDDADGQSDVFQYFGIIQRTLGNYEASLNFLFKSLELRERTGYTEGESLAFYHIGVTYKYLGNYEKALEELEKALAVARNNKHWIPESYALNNIGLIYFENEDYSTAQDYFHKSLSIRRQEGDKWGEAGCLDSIGLCFFKTAQYEHAIDHCSQSLHITQSIGDKKGQANSLLHLGNIYQQLKQFELSLDYYNRSLQIRNEIGDKKGQAEIILFLAGLYDSDEFQGRDENRSFDLMEHALKIGNEIKANDLLARIHHGFYVVCKKRDLQRQALVHLETYISIEKEIHTAAINQKIRNLEITNKVENSRREVEAIQLRNKELTELNMAIENQKKELEKALDELRSTQAQLIQSEKMASLGELTAGIAHEIQNPLNFVNNFSEINAELITELKTELESGNQQQASTLADNINDNEEKIIFHGKRADAIVKSMLQHSRASSGKKEPTDINALADEYLRLAYHGLRAKDKPFNAKFETDFDLSIDKIDIVPQEIGRVILNLINNAFYAVNEKAKASLSGYEPTVIVSTKTLKDKIEVSVKDNGNGIPDSIKEKIFQPFFTTKPAGQGTGLGLSLSYDIVRSQGGTIEVKTKEGEGSEFNIIFNSQ